MVPKVSILIPAFNRERFVGDAIRSMVEQDFDDFEVVAIDDGSTDGTADVLEDWRNRDSRVLVVTSPTNLGIPGALNLGLAHARGKYLTRLDSDDLMMPGRLAAQVTVLDARPDVTVVSCSFRIVDTAGNHLFTWTCDEPSEIASFFLNFYNNVGGPQAMYRLAEVREEGGFAVEHPATEDYDLCVRMVRRGRAVTLPAVGMTKRRHGNQSLVRYGGMKRASWTAIMRSSLERYLCRAVRDEEISALITLWRHDYVLGTSSLADDMMLEAFARFRAEVRDRALQSRARRRIARQWYIAARFLISAGQRLEGMKYLVHAARWLVSPVRKPLRKPVRSPRPDATA